MDVEMTTRQLSSLYYPSKIVRFAALLNVFSGLRHFGLFLFLTCFLKLQLNRIFPETGEPLCVVFF